MEKEIAILLADLTGYTAMTDVHGGASAAKIVSKYMDIVNASCTGRAKVMQRVGDQVLIIADDATDIATTANQIRALTFEETDFLAIHAGMHFGPVFVEGQSLFGSTINVASRIMNLAYRGQILCSSSFRARLPEETKALLRPIGSHKLKNVIDRIEIFELQPASDDRTVAVDPVCHMHLDPGKSVAKYVHNGITFHFCSQQCMKLFAESPGTFLEDHQAL